MTRKALVERSEWRMMVRSSAESGEVAEAVVGRE